ncbi:MAG: TolC family protein [Brevinematales bacterium]|nr:TolC family protein [Brevinematales bacterium]
MMRKRLILGATFCGFLLFLAPAWGEGGEEFISLLDYVNFVFYNTKDLQYKRSSLQLQKSSMIADYRAFFPSLSVGYGKNQRIVRYGDDAEIYSCDINVEQLVFAGGEMLMGIKQKQFSLERAQVQLKQEEKSFLLGLFVSYLKDFLLMRENILIKKEFLDVQRKEKAIAEKSLEIKEGTPLDLYEWRIAVKQSERELREMLENYQDVIEKMAHNLKKEGVVLFSREKMRGNIDHLTNVIEMILQRGEEEEYYRAMESSLELKEMAMKKQQLVFMRDKMYYNFIPQIKVSGGMSMSGEILPSSQIDWMVGVSINFPLFVNSGSISLGRGGNVDDTSKSYNSKGQMSVLSAPTYIVDRKSVEFQLSLLENERKEYLYQTKSLLKTLRRKLRYYAETLVAMEEELDLMQKKVNIQAVKFRLGEEKATDYIRSLLDLQSARVRKMQFLVETVQYIYQYYFLVGDVVSLEDLMNFQKELLFVDGDSKDDPVKDLLAEYIKERGN